MLKKSECICEKGSAPFNEDVANITNFGAWVLDGATCLNGHNIVDDESDAKWYVMWWNNYLTQSLCHNKPLKEIIRKGIISVKEEFTKKSGFKKLSDIDIPSSSFFVLRWNIDKTEFEYCGLGDCMLIVNDSKSLLKIFDKDLHVLDNTVLTKLGQLLNSSNITHEQGKSLVMDDIIRNRIKKDKPDGYHILGFDEDSADYMMYGNFKVANKTDVMIMSDGFYALFDKYNYMKLDDFIINVQDGKANVLYNTLRNIEVKDNNARKFPRFKVSDDASLVYLNFA